MLLPVVGRLFARPAEAELGPAGCGVGEARVSPGHVQVMISLTSGEKTVGRIAEELGVTAAAASQLVDRLQEYGMVERHHPEGDRRLVMVGLQPGMRDIARGIVESRRRPLRRAFEQMTDEECDAFVKGIRLLARSLREDERDA